MNYIYNLQRHIFVIQNVEFCRRHTNRRTQSLIFSFEYFILRDVYVAFMKAHDKVVIKTHIMTNI